MNSPIFSLRIPEDLLKEIRREAKRRNQSVAATIKQLTEEALAWHLTRK